MSSQYGEDAFILEHFAGRTGAFLDVGAHDGVTFSNTRLLADAGWSGVCVEPSPASFAWLMRNYVDRPGIELVCAAVVAGVADGDRLRTFHSNTPDGFAADALSTLLTEARDKQKGHPFRSMWTCPVTWSELLFKLPGPYLFVNIDVEGTNLAALRGLSMLIHDGAVKVEMVCVEVDPDDAESEMRAWLKHAGMSSFRRIGGNLLGYRA